MKFQSLEGWVLCKPFWIAQPCAWRPDVQLHFIWAAVSALRAHSRRTTR